MVRLFQQAFVEGPCALVLGFLFFKVDVSFPEQLGHVELRLHDGEFEDGAHTLVVFQAALELSELDPGGAVAAVPLDPLFVQRAAAGELEEFQLHFDVGAEELVLGAHADCGAHGFAGFVELSLAEFELSFEDPDFAEGEFLVREESEAFLIDLGGAVGVTVRELFVERVEDPEVDVAAPVSLFL